MRFNLRQPRDAEMTTEQRNVIRIMEEHTLPRWGAVFYQTLIKRSCH